MMPLSGRLRERLRRRWKEGIRHKVTPLGATQTLTQRHSDWWITVVGDVPPGTLRRFANGLERKK